MQVRRHLQTSLEEEDRASCFPPHSDVLFNWYNAWDGKTFTRNDHVVSDLEVICANVDQL